LIEVTYVLYIDHPNFSQSEQPGGRFIVLFFSIQSGVEAISHVPNVPPTRKPSVYIIVPRDHPEIEIEEEKFPAGDARAMGPRRDPAEVDRLANEAREILQE
jgi:hypothetical protein